LLPTDTLPKATLEGLADSCPSIPVPLKLMVAGEPGALLVIEMEPLADPLVVGVNVALNVVLCPAAIVIGVVMPLFPNPVPVMVTAETVTLAVPEFVSVIVWDPLLPTATFPKLTVEGLTES